MQCSQRNKTCQDNRNEVKGIICNENFVHGTFHKHMKGSSEEIWPQLY